MDITQAALVAAGGGLLPDVLRLVAARHDKAPEYLSRRFFWISLVLLAGVGALAGFLVRPTGLIEALAIGFSAPEILSKLMKRDAAPVDGPTRGGAEGGVGGLRSWWAV